MATTTHVKHSKLDRVEINQGLTIVHPDPDQPRKLTNEDIAVDIVAVPGLGANPDWTWKSKNKVDWLSDSNMLPRTIPNARVMILEYESQWFGKGSVNQRLYNVADQLVQALSNQRSRGSKRPIIFVCHCLGGIIVEKALLTAQLRQNDYPNIFMSVVGCIFLGTPFRGTKSQTKAAILAEMAETLGVGVNSGLLRMLEEGSETLKDLLSDFSALARESNMQLFCFFEQHASDLMTLFFKGSHPKRKELVVDEDSAHIDGYRTGALAADHFALNKFNGPKDGRYIAVSGEIKAAVQKAPGIIKSRRNAMRQTLVDDATYQTILDNLKATDPQKDLQDSLRGRPVNEATWALGNDHYNRWEEAKISKVLWIHGKAGKGQPVIACSIMHHLEKEISSKDGVFLAYFYCDEKDPSRRTVRDVLKLWIRQLIWKNRDLAEHLLVVEGTGKKGARKSLNFDTVPLAALWASLQKVLSDPFVEKVYFIVNAFDETDQGSRKEFLSFLGPYLEDPSEEVGEDETTVKWLFLSRSGRPDIEKRFAEAFIICTEDKENAAFVNEDLKREISGQIDELARRKGYNDALKYLIKRYVYEKADGNYIYAHLVVQELENLDLSQTNISTIRKLLEDLPYGLTDIFEFIRRRVLDPKSEGIEYTKEILRCLILVQESPTLHELALIADLPYDIQEDIDALKKYVRRCGAFLTTTVDEDGDEVIEWIDVVAKQHLTIYAKEELSLALDQVQHGIIALRCLEHVRKVFAPKTDVQDEDPQAQSLEQDSAEQNSTEDNDPETEGQDEHDHGENAVKIGQDDDGVETENQGISDATNAQPAEDASDSDENEEETPTAQPEDSQEPEPFLDYAVRYWLDHAMQAPTDIVEEFDLSDEFWAAESPVRDAWWAEYSQRTKHSGVTGVMPLHIAALIGYAALLDYLLDRGGDEGLHRADSWGYTPLSWACDYGDISLVDRLLKAGAEINHPAENGGPSALWAAAFCSHTEVVQHLLEREAEVNWENSERGTPLYVSASMNSAEIVRMLLKNGANVNLKGGWHIRPLNVASYSGFTEIVQILLEHGVEVTSDDDYNYASALGAAARRGYAEIVNLLLRKGWNAEQKLKTYNTPLVAAATYGHAEVVEILLANGAQGASQVQALEIASKNGRTDVVRCLLENSPHLPHHKAFHHAATQGRDETLELLEKRGTNLEMLNTALYDASDQERESTVRLLLKFGADPNAEGKEYGNALQAAAFDGSTGIVEALIASKADVNNLGGDYGNALQAAACGAHEDIVQTLLDHGAFVNTEKPIGCYGSALQAACSSQSSTLVELLIARNADVNAYGGLYGSPLMAAVDEAMQINVEILLKNGANVDVKDVRELHAPVLVMAGYTLGKEHIELLLNHGAGIDEADDEGTTAIIAAADSGDKESVEMLLAKGANIHAVSTTLGTALSAAASQGDEECLQVLLNHGSDPNQNSGNWGTSLRAAAQAADLDCINMLLDAGADVNKGDMEHGYPLQASASTGNTASLQRLLDAGATVNIVGDKVGFALAEAANAGQLDCLTLLLDRGADVNFQGGKYQCAIQAGCARPENYKCVKTLLERGADTHLNGGLFGSVMQAAAYGGNIDLIDLLLEHGAELNARGGKYGSTLQAAALNAGSEFVKRMLEHQVVVNDSSGKYGTALQAAAFAGDTASIALLLESGANPQLEGGIHGNALNAAVQRGNDNVVSQLLEQALPYHMLDRALVQAVYFRHDEVVNALLKKGASVEARDEEQRSTIELLQIPPGEDTNSDIDDDEENDGDDDEADDEDGEEDDGSSSEGDDDENDSADGATDDGASIANLELDDPTSAESKIQKLLEDAKAKIRRNPTLRRPAAIQRKPVTGIGVAGAGMSKPQQPGSLNGSYQISSDRWRPDSRPQNDCQYQAHQYGLSAPNTEPNHQYAAYGSRPPASQGYDTYNSRPPAPPSNASAYQANGHLQPQPSPYLNQNPAVNPDQLPPPPPPKAPNYPSNASIPYLLRPSYSSQNLNTAANPHPPPTPQRPQPTSNNSYQPYAPQPQQPTAYQTPTYQPPVSYQPSPPQSYPTQQQYQPPPANVPPTQAPYSAYSPPSPYIPPQSSQANPSSGVKPPPMPPRPSAASNQSSDSLDFDRLQQKAQKFAGRLWR